jgi:GT2 family glycosyltransferase
MKSVDAFILHCESPNGDELLRETYETLKASDYPNLNITVIENGCDVGWLPGECRFHLPTNLGFTDGINAGLGAGRGGDILLLNNDISINSTMVSHLVATAEKFGDCGIVAPRIYYHNSRKVWSDGGYFNPWTGAIGHHNIRKIGPAATKEREVDWASFCCVLIKREVIASVGLLDPRMSPYGEDLDYCLRARRVGWKVMINPKAQMTHKISQSVGLL